MGIRKKLKWLDPFTYVDLLLEKYYLVKGKKTLKQEIVYDIVYIVSAFAFALIAYTVLGLLLFTQSPFVIVMSGSMEPLMYRGDITMLHGTSFEELNAPLVELDMEIGEKLAKKYSTSVYNEAGVAKSGLKELEFSGGQSVSPSRQNDIIVYYSSINGQQIIHRLLAKIRARDGEFLLTKGDNGETNYTFDQDCKTVFGTDAVECIEPYPIPVEEIDGRVLFGVPVLGCVKIWPFDNLPYLLFKGKLPGDYRGLC